MKAKKITKKACKGKLRLSEMGEMQNNILSVLANIREEAATYKGEMNTSIEVIKVKLDEYHGDVTKLTSTVEDLHKNIVIDNKQINKDIAEVKTKVSNHGVYVRMATGISTVLGAIIGGIVTQVFHA